MWTVVGILQGLTSNYMAALCVIVILVMILKDESSKELIETQKEYIELLRQLQ